MRSLILHIAVRVLFPILIIASLMSLFRGHHEPGGGFIGGLVAASAYILLTLSMGVKKARSRLPMEPLFYEYRLVHLLSVGGAAYVLRKWLYGSIVGRLLPSGDRYAGNSINV